MSVNQLVTSRSLTRQACPNRGSARHTSTVHAIPEPTESAVLVAVPAAEPVVAAHRARFDQAAQWGVPAHVTVLYPFVPPAAIDEHRLATLGAALSAVPRFSATWRSTGWFGEDVVWLAPEPDRPFRALTASVCDAFPGYPPYGGRFDDVVPHLTIGDDGSTDELRAAERDVREGLPISKDVAGRPSDVRDERGGFVADGRRARPGLGRGTIVPMHDALISWYRHNARDLPWRAMDRTPWGVLVSEVMLQQTPVARVEPAWRAWMDRWPAAADLAAEPPAEAIRAWGRLGYPRRALRLHAAAQAIVDRHAGQVPAGYDDLRALPGVGGYTAAAVASFAFHARHAVLDTNVRRVFARALTGSALPPASTTATERRLAESLLPDDGPDAAEWAVAVMELGALVCTARVPRCPECPISHLCRWHQDGSPAYDGPPRRGQPWAGTDRQVRGRLMAALREADKPLDKTELDTVWPTDRIQCERALDSLVTDGLVDVDQAGYRLPSTRASPT